MAERSKRPASGGPVSRRGAIGAVGAVGAVGVVGGLVGTGLAGCGSDSGTASGSRSGSGSGSGSASPSATASPSGAGTSSPAGRTLGPASEIPVGGGKIYTEARVVVTQPARGQYKAFSALCTHLGCLVGKVAQGQIDCFCHGSRFSIKDGSVIVGPAQRPIKELPVAVEGGQVVLKG